MAGLVGVVAALIRRHKATQLGVQALLRANIIGAVQQIYRAWGYPDL